jgi:ABC-type Zn2+ transport system substrate-binding protein/surface adhesin
MVQTRNEMPDCGFFRYLHLNASKAAATGTTVPLPEESVSSTDGDTDDDDHDPNHDLDHDHEHEHEHDDDDDEIELIKDYSWRNFFSAINLVKILQKITKHRIHRILLMCQYKSSAILKRVLRVNQPMLQLQVLKLVKSQMPYCGRKWRSSE